MTLKEKLKEAGLNMAEDHVKMLFEEMIAIGEIVVEHTENPFDDVFLASVKSFKSLVEEQIDKIDGEEG